MGFSTCVARGNRRRMVVVAVATLIAARSAPAATPLPAAPGESLTAIDILLLPDQTMVEHADAANAKLRAAYPKGFALDVAHRPHITLLQRFIRTADRDAVFAAVDRVFEEAQPVGWELEAIRYFYVDFNGVAVAGIVVRPTPELRKLQQDILDAVAPFTRSGGNAKAFVTTAASPGINLATIQYVEKFVPSEIGEKYSPHVTIGVGPNSFVDRMKAAPFATFRFRVAGAAVFHLGDFGTAANELWSLDEHRVAP